MFAKDDHIKTGFLNKVAQYEYNLISYNCDSNFKLVNEYLKGFDKMPCFEIIEHKIMELINKELYHGK